MVFVKDFKREFYDVVLNQRVLMLVACDVDALCACRILQYLFQCDHIMYTIIPVSTKQELEEAFTENYEGMQYVVLVNCGANLDIIEMLQPPNHMVFFICDSHRPVDVHNIYNQVQIKLLMMEDEQEGIPSFDDVFRDEEEEEDEDEESNDSEEDGEQPPGKRRRFNAEALERKRELRIWNENRRRILLEYTEFSGHGSSAALLLYELAWKMSKDTNDLLWLAVVAVTEQYINHKVERDVYIESISRLQPHVSRLNHRPENSETFSINCLRILFDQELQLALYRHWSLFDSICHSQYIACKFLVWKMNGKKRLREFLADMGLPLVQCQQKFVSMDPTLKDSIKEMITKHADKYGISSQDIFLPSFHVQYGYRNKFCAEDVVHSCEAVLQRMGKDATMSGNFLQALDVLNRNKPENMTEGLELAKFQLKTLVTQVQKFMDMSPVFRLGPFWLATVEKDNPDAEIFYNPPLLTRLAKFTLEAHCLETRLKKAKLLPMVMVINLPPERGSTLVVGVAPLADKSAKNCFGKAFEQAAITSGSLILQDYFDSHVIELKLEDKSKFFDALTAILQD